MANIETANMAALFSVVDRAGCIEDALAIIKQIDALKVALESVGAFREKAIMYAKLEAAALIRAVELGGMAKLRGTHKATAEWLCSMAEAERRRYIEMCGDGLTIDQVYKREVGDTKKLGQQLDEITRRRDWLIEDVKKDGIVDITPFCETVRNVFRYERSQIAEDIIDGARNKLRKAGAVGIGDDSGVYVMRTQENQDKVKDALIARYESIVRDLKSMRDISKESGTRLRFQDLEDDLFIRVDRSPFVVHVLIALARNSVIENGDEMNAVIAQSGMAYEIKEVGNWLNIGRDEYIKAQYKAICEEDNNG